MKCKDWIEEYIKTQGPVTPLQTYEAGEKIGFSRKEIKAVRRWHGKYINTETRGGEILWRWNP